MPSRKTDPLTHMRKQAKSLIEAKYSTMEEFCWDKGLNKATMSNFMKGNKDFQLSTLVKISEALGKSLKIRLE